MTWWAEQLAVWRRTLGLGWAVLAAVAYAADAGTGTNVPPDAVPAAPVVPVWMHPGVLTTNAAEWMDLAEIWRKQPEAEVSPMENFTMPVEHYEDGRIRAMLRAGRAAIGRNGLVWAWQVVMDFQNPQGGADGRITAASCLYDRNARRGYCPEQVELCRTNVTIRGYGLYWVMGEQRMQMLSNAMVYLPHVVSLPIPAGNGSTGRSRPARTNAVPAADGERSAK
jgi:hypothetical protein